MLIQKAKPIDDDNNLTNGHGNTNGTPKKAGISSKLSLGKRKNIKVSTITSTIILDGAIYSIVKEH